MADLRLYAPAALRNRDPITALLRQALPSQGLVLELASGSGEHAVHLAGQFPALTFQPSDVDPTALASIAAWREASGLANLLPPIALDTRNEPWPVGSLAAILCINMLHIAPWEAGLALFRGAARHLAAGGLLYLYGPYDRGPQTEPSNREFDASLKSRNPAWGLRALTEVLAIAEAHGFALEREVEMPANNRSLLLRRS